MTAYSGIYCFFLDKLGVKSYSILIKISLYYIKEIY